MSLKSESGDESTSLEAAELRLLRSRVSDLDETATRLRGQLHETRRRVSITTPAELCTNTVLNLESGAAGAGCSNSNLVAQLQRRLSEVTMQLTERTKECETLKAVSGAGVVQELRSKLEMANADVGRLMAEREKLWEISNMLRADLNRVLTDGAAAACQTTEAATAERIQREVAARYQTKLVDIEAAMRELVEHNRALKGELRRWTADGLDAIPAPSVGAPKPSKPSRLTTAGSRHSGVGTKGRPSLEMIAPAPLTNATMVASRSSGTSGLSPFPAAAAAAACADSDAELGGLLDGNEDGDGDSDDWLRGSTGTDLPASDLPPSTSDPAPTACEARVKLKEAKRSLSLAGSTPSLFERPAALGATRRGTESQSKARLDELQRKRTELSRKRQGVRNWAVEAK